MDTILKRLLFKGAKIGAVGSALFGVVYGAYKTAEVEVNNEFKVNAQKEIDNLKLKNHFDSINFEKAKLEMEQAKSLSRSLHESLMEKEQELNNLKQTRKKAIEIQLVKRIKKIKK